MRINDGGIGGLFARSTFGPMTPSFAPKEPLGYKANINNTAPGKKTGQFYTVRVNSASHGGGEFPALPGEWSLLEIIADGKRIHHLVDGKESQVFPEAKLYPSGHIALYLDNPAGVLECRNIEIKETAPPAAPKERRPDAAPFERDAAFVPLFNGKDLTGWKSANRPGSDWRVVNGVLTGTGTKLRELYTRRDDYGDFHLRAEVRIDESGMGKFCVRYPHAENQIENLKTGGYMVLINGRQDVYKTGLFFDPKYFGKRSWHGYERNRHLRNNGDGTFAEIGRPAGTDLLMNSRGVAVADFWNRGALDIAVAASTDKHALLKNDVGTNRHWLGVELVGTTTNRDAVGARVYIRMAGKQQMREVVLGDGYGSQSSLRQYFGLSDQAKVDELTVRWPKS